METVHFLSIIQQDLRYLPNTEKHFLEQNSEGMIWGCQLQMHSQLIWAFQLKIQNLI